MVPIEFSLVERLPSNVISSNLCRAIPKELLSAPSYYIQAPHSIEWITFFSSSPSPSVGIEDAQNGKKLVFFLKQFDYELPFPLSRFFIRDFRFYGASSRMLTLNSILFMRAFEAIC